MRYALLVSAMLLAFAAPVQAFTTLAGETSGDATWTLPTVPVFLDVLVSPDVSLPAVEEALAGSLATWSAADCSTLRLEYAGLVAGPPKFGIYIHWADPSMVGDVVGVDAAAVTETWLTASGEIFRADMHLNPLFAWATAEEAAFPENNDVEGVITHELGHAIGLSHSRGRMATMYFAGGDASLRSLDDDDVRAVCYQYPAAPFTDGHACDTCSAHSHCGSGRCLTFPEGGDYCAPKCAKDADCTGGFSCTAVPGQGKLCLPNNQFCHEGGGTIALGEYCYGHATCASGFCLPTRTSAQCTDACGDDVVCPAGMACVPMSGECDGPCALCMTTGDGKVGESCQDATSCAGALCVGEGDTGQCSAFCDPAGAPCPDGASCPGGLCMVPGPRPTGAPCGSGFDCAGMLCISLGDGAQCSAVCGDDSPCGGSATCQRFDLARVCASDADCAGAPCVKVKGGRICGCTSDEQCGVGESCGVSGLLGPKVCQLQLCEASASPSNEGELCGPGHDCVEGLGCDLSFGDFGLCRTPCTPGGPCPVGAGCAWAGGSPPAGICQPLSGASLGAACSGTAPCQPGLACVSVGGASTCAADCVLPDGPCPGACVDLKSDAFPGRGACLASGDVPVLILPSDPPPPGPDAGFGGGASLDGKAYEPVDRPPPDDGCRAVPRSPGGLWALLMLLAIRKWRSGGVC